MIRLALDQGWRLVTHPDHAGLAGDFAEAWGNKFFSTPEPRAEVLKGIRCHDDGWKERDAQPFITREGRPGAFSVELVGKYSAFEEINLADYLAVRGRALDKLAQDHPYAAVIVSMHTSNLLTARADRSTIKPAELPLLDDFIAGQKARQASLREDLAKSGKYGANALSEETWRDHFRLLQACDNLSLLACVGYMSPATLLHPLPQKDGTYEEVHVQALAPDLFELDPFPFPGTEKQFSFPSRSIAGTTFASSADLQQAFNEAKVESVPITFRAA
jgi:hypothetical protein